MGDGDRQGEEAVDFYLTVGIARRLCSHLLVQRT